LPSSDVSKRNCRSSVTKYLFSIELIFFIFEDDFLHFGCGYPLADEVSPSSF
jgi:hypothetical protein